VRGSSYAYLWCLRILIFNPLFCRCWQATLSISAAAYNTQPPTSTCWLSLCASASDLRLLFPSLSQSPGAYARRSHKNQITEIRRIPPNSRTEGLVALDMNSGVNRNTPIFRMIRSTAGAFLLRLFIAIGPTLNLPTYGMHISNELKLCGQFISNR